MALESAISKKIVWWLLWMAGLVVLFIQPVAGQARLEQVGVVDYKPRERCIVRIRPDTFLSSFSSPRLLETGELEVILFNSVLNELGAEFQPDGPVLQVTSVQAGPHVRIRLMVEPSYREGAQLFRDRSSSDLLLALHWSVPRRQLVTDRESNPLGNRFRRWAMDTIVIDAGHGGKDSGATGNGVQEKDVTLAVARRVGTFIAKEHGIHVVYTREDDRFIALQERGRLANREGGKLFVSIHANASTRSDAHGTETYFLGLHRNEAAKNVMDRENSVIRFEDNPDDYSRYDENELVVRALALSAFQKKSERLAGLIERGFEESTGLDSRGVKQAGFYVLWNASMPAVLIELGFITNPDEAAFLSSEPGQEVMARVIFGAITDFIKQYEKDIHLLSEE